MRASRPVYTYSEPGLPATSHFPTQPSLRARQFYRKSGGFPDLESGTIPTIYHPVGW
jgi:hypothetical protein